MRLFKTDPQRCKNKSTVATTAAPRSAAYGLKGYHEPEGAMVDIVFVHGLNGDRDRTWTADKASVPWPRALLPKRLPNARILSFGYDSTPLNIQGMISSNAVGNHARNLLSELVNYRLRSGSVSRPIVFVAHSMGGIVCQDMLLASQISPETHLRTILECTKGIAFLGTPSSGSDLASWAEPLAKFLGFLWPTNMRILGILRKDSEILARIQDDFHGMLINRLRKHDGEINITCFYEELPIAGIGKVVPYASATFSGYTSIGIHKNHKDMVRFENENDPGFVSLVAEVERWVAGLESSEQEYDGSDVIEPEILAPGYVGGITIWGDVHRSSVVQGNQTVNGDIKISD